MIEDVTLVYEPQIFVVGHTEIDWDGAEEVGRWLSEFEPDCFPDGFKGVEDMFPHDASTRADGTGHLTGPELLVEFFGRLCYNSYGAKAGRKTNSGYIANLFGKPGEIPHASVLYGATVNFVFADVSRRLSHELIRTYVGADREERGNPSQQSTRYTIHPGRFVVHPRDVGRPQKVASFKQTCAASYSRYKQYLNSEFSDFQDTHGDLPKGGARKEILEAAAHRLGWAISTAFAWSANPISLAKQIRERTDLRADREYQRFAKKLEQVCHARWPNLFKESNPSYKHD